MLHGAHPAPKIWIKEILRVQMHALHANIPPSLGCRDSIGAQNLNTVTIAHSGFKFTLISCCIFLFFPGAEIG